MQLDFNKGDGSGVLAYGKGESVMVTILRTGAPRALAICPGSIGTQG